jgi:LPXTG-site transpeptidase (sortase) family protein
MKKGKIESDRDELKSETEKIKKKRFDLADKIILTIAILLLLGSAVLLLWNPVQNYLRTQKTNELVAGIEQGNVTAVVDPDALQVNGEDIETFVTTAEPTATTGNASMSTETTVSASETTAAAPVTPKPTKYDPAEKLTLTALGTIEIDKINLLIPLWNDAGIVPLRYGAGKLASSALPGQDGNCVILGHRMKAYGSLFNRLDEVAIGDSIVIKTVDGTEYTYIVDNVIPALDPVELLNYVQIDSGVGKQITLVTCTPVGVGTSRIIVIGHMA